MIKLFVAALLLARLMMAQGIDSFKLIDNPTPHIAVDSLGNLVTVQLTANAWVVYRYDSHGLVAQTLNGPNQVVSATNAFTTVLALDSSDNIYVAGETFDRKAILLRPSDPPGQAPWTPSISGAPLGIVGMAFDPQGNPVVLALDSRGGPSQVLKIHRGSGEILAVYTFASSNPVAVATDSAGAVYVGGGTTSAQFPVTSGAWPAYCQPAAIGAHYNCSQAFVTKLDSGLQRVVYSSLLAEGWAVAIAVAPGGGVYAGIDSGSGTNSPPQPPGSVFSLDSQGSVVASSTAVPGSADDLHLDSSGNVIAIGSTQSGSLCGPDRPNLGRVAVFVTRFDSHLAGISSSVVIPQQHFIGWSAESPAALLADGTLYVPVQPMAPGFSGVLFPGIRVLHVSFEAPPSIVTCLANGANFFAETHVAPGQLLTIFGHGLSSDPAVAFDSTRQLLFAAHDLEVLIGGLAAPLLYVSPTQINVIVPYGIQVDAQLPVEIHRGGSVVFAWTLESVPRNATPLLRFSTDGAFQLLANALNEDGTSNSQQNPARTGSMVTVYATGFGQLTPALADGAPGTASGAVSNGGIGTWNFVTQSYVLQPASVATIPGWTNAVLAVRFQVPSPALPGIPELAFYVTPPVTTRDSPAAYIYVTQ
jgi:uncharacterized protein (TIGR03437 family)